MFGKWFWFSFAFFSVHVSPPDGVRQWGQLVVINLQRCQLLQHSCIRGKWAHLYAFTDLHCAALFKEIFSCCRNVPQTLIKVQPFADKSTSLITFFVLCVLVCIPIESGRCCNMLEESSRSSRASQPETSESNVSMRFLARSKYRNWRSFPIDCRGWERRGTVNDSMTTSLDVRVDYISPLVSSVENCYPATAPSGCVSAPTPLANRQKNKNFNVSTVLPTKPVMRTV